jgi:hypothetical protein
MRQRIAVLVPAHNESRDILPLGSIWSITRYVICKLPLYRQILSRNSGQQSIRTVRKKIEDSGPD